MRRAVVRRLLVDLRQAHQPWASVRRGDGGAVRHGRGSGAAASPLRGHPLVATGRGAAVAVYLALFTVFLAYRLFGYGLRHTPASVATSLTLAEPAVAAVLGVTVLGQRLPTVSWCGLAVLGPGLVLLTAPGRPGRVAAPVKPRRCQTRLLWLAAWTSRTWRRCGWSPGARVTCGCCGGPTAPR
ncbi:DMT family transporter [Streptomyces guryensis]|uniref:DMT family transporter n=1 Tax=Streptomyces guryensis TaxID=2886947 RepID=A0A9Q3VJD6_9ACTN|nr:DMT family transporter [Streptomyces guryensis]